MRESWMGPNWHMAARRDPGQGKHVMQAGRRGNFRRSQPQSAKATVLAASDKNR